MIDDLEFLTNKKLAEEFLNNNANAIFDSMTKIEVLDINRSKTYNPDSYNILYKLKVGENIKKIRASASKMRVINKKNEYQLIKHYYDNGFSAGDELVAKPLHYFDEYNLMFYEDIEGEVFFKNLNTGIDVLKTKVVQCARALKKIHNLPKPNTALWDADHLFIYQSFEKNALKIYYPKLYDQLDTIVGTIKEESNNIKNDDFCHGDFQPTNIIFAKDKLFVLDFGMNCLLDKEYDIACFINQMQIMLRRYGDYGNFQKVRELFLTTYGEYDKEKYDLYAALINLRILVVFCITPALENNIGYTPFIYEILKKDLRNIGIKIDA